MHPGQPHSAGRDLTILGIGIFLGMGIERALATTRPRRGRKPNPELSHDENGYELPDPIRAALEKAAELGHKVFTQQVDKATQYYVQTTNGRPPVHVATQTPTGLIQNKAALDSMLALPRQHQPPMMRPAP